MPWIDQRGDKHPSITDTADMENDALHFICCLSCQHAMPWVWNIIKDIEAHQGRLPV